MCVGLRDRAFLAGPFISVATLVMAIVASRSAGVSLHDPGHISVLRFVTAAVTTVIVAVVVRLTGRAAIRNRSELLQLWSALVSFYVTYFAYRNLKSVVPLVRVGTLYDAPLTRLDRGILGGHAPATVLQDLLGRGLAASVLAPVYMAFFLFIPLVLAVSLSGLIDARSALLVVTTLALTWVLGAASYYLLPSLGPFHDRPGAFAHLRPTAVTHMQRNLLADRAAFIRDPVGLAGQSVGAFASLHVAIYVAATLAAIAVGARRLVVIALALATVLTVLSTVYFGWHYLADDVAGAAIAVASLWLARRAVGVPRPELARVPAL